MKKILHFIQSKIISLCAIFIGLYILYLSISDKLSFYIHPDYKIFATIMAVFIIVFGIASIFIKHNHFENIPLYRVIIPMLLIVLLGFLLPPAGLTSNTALRRGLDNDTSTIVRSSDDVQVLSSFGKDTRTYDISVWLKSFSINPEPTEYIGKKVSVTGFYHIPENNINDTFTIARYVITCCSVDARPVGLTVQQISNTNLSENDWVKVDGEFNVMEVNSKNILVIKPDIITKVDKPNNPYIY